MLPLYLFSAFAALVAAVPASSERRQDAGPCSGNTADDRSVWCDYDISTDYYDTVPDTGVTREYWLEITNTTLGPDGVERVVLSVNNTSPGPLIWADWGDTVVVHVSNSLSINGSSIHWHGIRQNYTVQNDGVPSITQCPTVPGETYTYTWRATAYGSSWYHSHYALQAWEGVFGPVLINGPATANYDVDAGSITLSDWSHQTADALYSYAQTVGPPTLSTGLINGTNSYNNSGTTVGSRFEMNFEAGTSYKLRLVNVAIDTYFKFSIDNHTLTVIAADFVPIVPYTTDVLSIAMGQRYEVIVTADQGAEGDYWMRATMMTACSENDNPDDTKGIIRYDSSSTADPTTTGYDYVDECVDEAISNLVPYVSRSVDTGDSSTLPVTVAKNTDGWFKWSLGTTSMVVEWGDPTLLQIQTDSAATFEANDAVQSLDTANSWVYYVISTTLPVPHPIHLHGHDFYVLAQAASATYSSSVALNLSNPPRRDTVNLPASGYVVIAFYTDNPGAWLMHCHIGWHTEEGLAVQFVERQSEIPGLLDNTTLTETCDAWNAFQTSIGLVEEDSGI
ncbi:laccase-1 [Pseudovirgaria hyperparasitica]|uniref:Laccase-1 n=1 Tax=Pseudovirgaria hyperparasitica TaxID=470096 RepID=A0A6A6WC20_9PEZI|nr:laccase-1 [Pseudovirgaria hyperparasitica]KAF2760125.1 laccase-1 [Pseudovirgaria hyperparasitica]